MPETVRSHVIPFAFGFLALCASTSSALADEYTVDTIPRGYDVPETGLTEVIASGQDDTTASVTLPFDFRFFGRSFSTITVCANGWLAMGTASVDTSENPVLPSALAPNGVIAPLWDDLHTRDAGSVRTFVSGTEPSRVFAIDWNDVENFDGSATDLRFQARLYETTGVIEFAYGDGGTYTGLSYSAAIEDPGGTLAFGAAGLGNTFDTEPALDARFTPRELTVSGTLLRDRPVADETGLGNSVESGLPVAGATVQLLRADTGELAGTAVTRADGSFAVSALGIDLPSELILDLVTEGPAARVVGVGSAVYTHRIAEGIAADPAPSIGTLTFDADVDATNPLFRRALNILQALERGRVVAQTAVEINPPLSGLPERIDALPVVWIDGSAHASGNTVYLTPTPPATPSMVVSGAPTNPDAYDDDVLLRTYAHFVIATLSAHPGGPSGDLAFDSSSSPEDAWVEGFSYWFACAVQERDVFIDTVSATEATVLDLEMPPAGARGSVFPAAVAGSLWDLVDGADEPEDEVAGSTQPLPSSREDVLAVVDRALDTLAPGQAGFTVRDFFDNWSRADTESDRARRIASSRVFIHHRTLPDDTSEADDRISEAPAFPGLGKSISGRQLSPSNDDFYEVVLPGPDPILLVVSVRTTPAAAIVLELQSSEGVPVATTMNTVAPLLGDVRVSSPAPLPPGTYYARVSSRDLRTAGYSISFFEPLQVDLSNVPAWTVGRPFKVDFTVVGGIPPYTFVSTAGGAAGLTLSQGGARLSGTPSSAGEFEISVNASDSAVPPAGTTATTTLTINPIPFLPPLFAFRADTAVDLALGQGGTGPHVWAVSAPGPTPPAGLQVVDGAMLRIVGNAPGATSFSVTATGGDAVGAVVGPATGTSTVIATTPLVDVASSRTGEAVPEAGDGTHFGYHFEAFADSDVDLTFRFRGTGARPTIVALLDEQGGNLIADAKLRHGKRGASLRLKSTPAAGRYHVVLERAVKTKTGKDGVVVRTKERFSGTVKVRARVTPPRRLVGEAPILRQDDGRVVEVALDLRRGSIVTVGLRRSRADSGLLPDLLPVLTEVITPTGMQFALPTPRLRRRGGVAIYRITIPEGDPGSPDGRYLFRFSGAEGTAGPLVYGLKVKSPADPGLTLD